jgi:DNA modification methylase
MDYQTFLTSKAVSVQPSGFEVAEEHLNPALFDWQRAIVKWALGLGKAAIFAECGLGKTLMQLEWARHVAAYTGAQVIVLAPLAVAHQTVAEGRKFGITARYCRSQEAADAAAEAIIVTNYDMLKSFDPDRFAGVVLDESSILKSFTGQTKRAILQAFERTPFKLACTATPAPNDHLELGNHAEFLNVMASNEMISRWFINDTMSAGKYRLKGHAAADFWQWVASWGVCIGKPSDLGANYSDDGFNLPELRLHSELVQVDHSRAQAQGRLFVDGTQSATAMWAEKRATARDRCRRAREIVGDSTEPWIVWCDTNDEADILKGLFPEAVEVRGSDSIAHKEERLTAFSEGRARQIITKADIAGFGLNWQHCHNQVFVGLTYSFEKTYQALRRSWRFGQTWPVDAYLIYAESEGNIMQAIREKQEAHTEMQQAMTEAMRTVGLTGQGGRKMRADVEEGAAQGRDWTMYLGDCVQSTKRLPDNSVHLTVFSPPFSTLYIYSDSLADMGNSADDGEFFRHFDYLIPELLRVTAPGRNCCVHCKDLPLYKNRDGAAGLRDFPGEIIRRFEAAGWTYHSRVTIWKDPVIEMQRTKNHGLLHKNFTDRAEACRQGMADYVITFRKWTPDMPDKQVRHNPVPGDYIGENPPERWDDQRHYSIQTWQRYASPVWMDIDQTNVLNYQVAREDKDEKHICPLQLDVIERCIWLWSNPGDVVLSPFAGIGSEGVVALKQRRKFIGIELKRSYWQQACRYLQDAELQSDQPTLFSMDAVV